MKEACNHTKIRFWGGLRTIGGTIVSIEYKESRVIFDFGLIFSPDTSMLDEKIEERSSKIVKDYLKLGLIPPIDGIYQAEDLEGLADPLPEERDARHTAVIVSHLHLDHMGGVGMLSPQIPVYFTEDSLKLYRSLEVVGEAVKGHKPSLRACTYNETFQIGEICITPIRVDHDVIGACGFHVQTPDGAVFYTGDFRLHGKNPQWMETAIEKVKDRGFDVLIMEGTTLRGIEERKQPIIADRALPTSLVKEASIAGHMMEILQETTGLGLFNIYHRNIERLKTMLEVANLAKRKLVFELETAYIAEQFLGKRNFSVYLPANTKHESIIGTLPGWKEDLMSRYETVEASVINRNPSAYLLQMSYENSLELFDLHVSQGVYLHSNGTPLGDYDPAYHHLINLLNMLGVPRFLAGTGGHAIPQHLKYVLERLNPKTLIPLHSFHPERLIPDHGRLVMPEYGLTYVLKNNELYKSNG
ncbi:MBL fold metallo-hydrolase [Agaribacter marinus]|uniref:MBL fold metallo-hydrolase n=2 Tax=Virgibacillus salarius TaxID=447199 RepID=A0A941DQ65_9BACI|nr:MBL fold metallo-hydrolase [Virgibacillus salarius]MBR7794919.1 MBL fold metallo-hydrolase [Virgibacillus salarius]NAZ07639.1 MBL fold metallo-hydrolase [Agaribacter marinus]